MVLVVAEQMTVVLCRMSSKNMDKEMDVKEEEEEEVRTGMFCNFGLWCSLGQGKNQCQ